MSKVQNTLLVTQGDGAPSPRESVLSCPMLFDITCPSHKTLVEVSLLDSTIELPAGAFKGCVSLKTVEYPCTPSSSEDIASSTLSVSIPSECFSGCVLLETVLLPYVLRVVINDNAFSDCVRLSELTNIASRLLQSTGVFLRGSVHVRTKAFYRCNSLTACCLEDSVIDKLAFDKCAKLRDITLSRASMLKPLSFNKCAKLASAIFCSAYKKAPCTNSFEMSIKSFNGCLNLNQISINSSLSGVTLCVKVQRQMGVRTISSTDKKSGVSIIVPLSENITKLKIDSLFLSGFVSSRKSGIW